ncbi:MAG: glycerol-3-phosphate dehydrogenase C-terminal domain-containing protein, partial [Parasphingopyxis sp.]
VSHYSGVRSLYDDGASDAREVTRDYVLELDGGSEEGVPPLLSVFGGKITTARALAEDANDRLAAATPFSGAAWTKRAKFPGGETGKDVDAFVSSIQERYPFLEWEHAVRLVRAYGSMLPDIFGEAATFDDLGGHFGEGLTVRELEWMCEREWAKSADDALMRRSKLGLLLDEATVERVNAWFAERSA